MGPWPVQGATMPHAQKGLPLDGLKHNTLVAGVRFRGCETVSSEWDAPQSRYSRQLIVPDAGHDGPDAVIRSKPVGDLPVVVELKYPQVCVFTWLNAALAIA